MVSHTWRQRLSPSVYSALPSFHRAKSSSSLRTSLSATSFPWLPSRLYCAFLPLFFSGQEGVRFPERPEPWCRMEETLHKAELRQIFLNTNSPPTVSIASSLHPEQFSAQ